MIRDAGALICAYIFLLTLQSFSFLLCSPYGLLPIAAFPDLRCVREGRVLQPLRQMQSSEGISPCLGGDKKKLLTAFALSAAISQR